MKIDWTGSKTQVILIAIAFTLMAVIAAAGAPTWLAMMPLAGMGLAYWLRDPSGNKERQA